MRTSPLLEVLLILNSDNEYQHPALAAAIWRELQTTEGSATHKVIPRLSSFMRYETTTPDNYQCTNWDVANCLLPALAKEHRYTDRRW